LDGNRAEDDRQVKLFIHIGAMEVIYDKPLHSIYDDLVPIRAIF
jgi:hypothetical protein